MESLLCGVAFNPIRPWKMEQIAVGTMQCSMDENRVIQSNENSIEMEAMTC